MYPGYDVSRALASLAGNLAKAASPPATSPGDCICLGLLAESKRNRFYREVRREGYPSSGGTLLLASGPDEGCLTILDGDAIKGWLIAGRQIVTRERLEILGLGRDITVPDGLPAEDTLKAIRAEGAAPVLSWAPGKWFSSRGELVEKLIVSHEAGDFLIGDTGLRPAFWGLPRLMRLARERGYRIIGGSDPLPLPDEEAWLGTYGITITAAFDPGKPAESMRQLLADTSLRFTPLGHRCPPLAFTSRWIRNQFRDKKAINT